MSRARPVVVLALTPVAEQAIEGLLFGPEAPIEPRASVAEADELEREAVAVAAEAVLLSPGLSGLSAAHCARVRALGLRLVGLALDQRERDALAALAVDEIVDGSVSADELVRATGGDDGPPQSLAVARPPDAAAGARGKGSVLAVVGSKGAPGASECAASLAALAAQRWPALLVELDMLSGGLDVRIGTGAQQGSVLGLARAASCGEPIDGLLERWVTAAPGWPPVLLAPTELDGALGELARPGATAAALRALRARMPLTVCDVGFVLDTGDEVAPPARVHREALVSADVVLLVLGARDAHQRPGIAQLDLLLGPLAIPPQRLRVAVNGVGGPGAASEQTLNETLLPRLAERGLTADAWLAWDGRALERARRKGPPLAIARRRGRYAKVLTQLVDEMFLPASPTPRARKHKLAPAITRHEASSEEREVALPWRS